MNERGGNLDDLIERGEALIEARRNPANARKTFADFGDAYHRWNAAGSDLIVRLCGRAGAGLWSAGRCRAMYSLDDDPAACIREQKRQQAMLLELRGRSGAARAMPRSETSPTEQSGDARRKKRHSLTLPMATRAFLLIEQGLSNRAIAAELGLSESAIRRSPALRRARAALKARKRNFPSGSKSRDGRLEAYDESEQE